MITDRMKLLRHPRIFQGIFLAFFGIEMSKVRLLRHRLIFQGFFLAIFGIEMSNLAYQIS